MVEITPAHTAEEVEHVIRLAHEYVTWMIAEIEQQYPQLDISEFASEHDYDDIRRKFPGEHVPPDGCLLIASNDGNVCGCIALGRMTETACEMRTLYVQPAFRGLGIGKLLAEASLIEARRQGYRHVQLDTLAFMNSALRLYQSLGFRPIEPYRELSDSLKPYIRFLELDLTVSV